MMARTPKKYCCHPPTTWHMEHSPTNCTSTRHSEYSRVSLACYARISVLLIISLLDKSIRLICNKVCIYCNKMNTENNSPSQNPEVLNHKTKHCSETNNRTKTGTWWTAETGHRLSRCPTYHILPNISVWRHPSFQYWIFLEFHILSKNTMNSSSRRISQTTGDAK